MSSTYQYIVITVLIICGFFIFKYLNQRKTILSLKLKLKEQWAAEPKTNYNPGEIDSIASFYNNKREDKKGIHFIDDITWNDLDMDRVFMRINNTQSSIGEEYLYYLLHEPVFDGSTLQERNRLIEYFRTNPGKRSELQLLFAKLGKSKHLNISEYFFGSRKNISVKSVYYKLLAAISLLSPLSLIIDVQLGISVIILSIALNTIVYYRSKNRIAGYLESLSYVIGMVVTAKKFSGISIPEIDEYRSAVRSSVSRVKSVISKSFWLLYTTENYFIEYLRVVLLGELIAFEGMFEVMYNHQKDFQKIYEVIGLLDSIIAIASYRDSIEYFALPVINKSAGNGGYKILFKDAYHPLITDPVVNSFEIGKPVLITGSNASGKSTFLKTVAINAIFAQTIYTCLAKEYTSDYFMIFSSMALKDNLKGNESYYIAEIKSLKRIFDSINASFPCLCFIDEVLRGTNTVERIAASSEVLLDLSRRNSLCMAATHDIELTVILGKVFENYHFQENFTDNDIVFDYKIYPGRSNTRNAIKLLHFMGYDDNIVKSAEDRALHFINNGIWKEIAP